jgi:hypothetical protein
MVRKEEPMDFEYCVLHLEDLFSLETEISQLDDIREFT